MKLQILACLGCHYVTLCQIVIFFIAGMQAQPQPHSQVLSSKMGRGESLVKFLRKAVDFQSVVIHVTKVGRSQFSSNCQ